jgi:spore germination protein YaaH
LLLKLNLTQEYYNEHLSKGYTSYRIIPIYGKSSNSTSSRWYNDGDGVMSKSMLEMYKLFKNDPNWKQLSLKVHNPKGFYSVAIGETVTTLTQVDLNSDQVREVRLVSSSRGMRQSICVSYKLEQPVQDIALKFVDSSTDRTNIF